MPDPHHPTLSGACEPTRRRRASRARRPDQPSASPERRAGWAALLPGILITGAVLGTLLWGLPAIGEGAASSALQAVTMTERLPLSTVCRNLGTRPI
jgi:TRAP-type mannitol/chloroaromatic compound transport system permease large subunit